MLGVPFFSKPPNSLQDTTSLVIPFGNSAPPRTDPTPPPVSRYSPALIHSNAAQKLQFEHLKGLDVLRQRNLLDSAKHTTTKRTRSITPNLFHSHHGDTKRLIQERNHLTQTVHDLDELVRHLTHERDLLKKELSHFHCFIHSFTEYLEQDSNLSALFHEFFQHNAHIAPSSPATHKKSNRRKAPTSAPEPPKSPPKRTSSPAKPVSARTTKKSTTNASPARNSLHNSRSLSPARATKSSHAPSPSSLTTSHRKSRKRSTKHHPTINDDIPVVVPQSPHPPQHLPIRPHSAMQAPLNRPSPNVNRRKSARTPNLLNFTYDSTVDYELIIGAAFRSNHHYAFESPDALLRRRSESAAAFVSGSASGRASESSNSPPQQLPASDFTPSPKRFKRRWNERHPETESLNEEGTPTNAHHDSRSAHQSPSPLQDEESDSLNISA